MTSILETAVYSVYCVCLSRTFINLYVCFSPFCYEAGMSNLIILLPD